MLLYFLFLLYIILILFYLFILNLFQTSLGRYFTVQRSIIIVNLLKHRCFGAEVLLLVNLIRAHLL